ncbi:MAG: formate dehydrogenase accessory sulfurtransferase FdhD [Negativicutes bacterium]
MMENVLIKQKYSAVILAGGRSSRMGCDKALLEYNGQTAVEYLAGQLKSLFTDIVISINRNQALSIEHCRTVSDEIDDFGPLAGLAAGLRATKHETVFVVAVDSPKIDARLIEQLLAAMTADCIAVMPEKNGRLEPLYAVYGKRAVAVIDELIARNIHRPTALTDSGLVKRFVLDSEQGIENINTRADYERFCQAELAAVITQKISRFRNGVAETSLDELIAEQRVVLRTPDEQRFLCTPVNLRELFVGWGYSQGLLSGISDVTSIERCNDFAYRMLLQNEVPVVEPVREFIRPEISFMQKMQRTFFEQQVIFRRTGAAHAAGFFDSAGNLLSFFEDIGRHNALDKAIGALVISGNVQAAKHLLLSSRVSVELLEKIRRVPVGAVYAVSAPSNAAVELADGLGLALIGFFRDNRYNFYNDKETNNENIDC